MHTHSAQRPIRTRGWGTTSVWQGRRGQFSSQGQGPWAAGFSAQLSPALSAPGGLRRAVWDKPSRGPACPVSLGHVTRDTLPEG